jgi:hypothetical protein
MELDWPADTLRSLERKMGHPPPWSSDELESVKATILGEGRRSLPWLKRLPGLRSVKIGEWQQPVLDDLRSTSKLRRLALWDCTDVDITPLPEVAPNLNHVELRQCYVHDLTPLLRLPKLRSINLDGLPMSEDSWHRVVPELLARGIPHVGNYPMMTDDEWRIMHTLAQRGLLLSVYRGAWGNAGIKAVGNATAYPTIVFHKLDNLAAAVEAFQGSTLEQLWPHLNEASDQEEEPPEHEDA